MSNPPHAHTHTSPPQLYPRHDILHIAICVFFFGLLINPIQTAVKGRCCQMHSASHTHTHAFSEKHGSSTCLARMVLALMQHSFWGFRSFQGCATGSYPLSLAVPRPALWCQWESVFKEVDAVDRIVWRLASIRSLRAWWQAGTWSHHFYVCFPSMRSFRSQKADICIHGKALCSLLSGGLVSATGCRLQTQCSQLRGCW